MRPSRPRSRRGFTLVELIVAGVLTAMIVGTLSTTLGQLSRAKGSCRERLDAHLRADMALNNIRRDFAAIIRADDLFYTRFLLLDDDVNSTLGVLPRDEAVVFCTRLRPIRSLDFNGEGSEYETQYRVDEETGAPVLWQRRDAFPDDYPLAGGQAEPLVEHILSLEIEAYDGEQWYVEWDSDEDGLPLAVRVTVMASGARSGQDSYDAVTATMRTVIPIDRIPPPVDQLALTEEELEELDARVLIDPETAATGENDESDEDEGQNGESGGTGGTGGTSGRGNRGGSGGGGGGGGGGGSGDSGEGRGGGSGPDRQDFDDNLPPT